jgi:acetyltransferase-like isoleucine patch superfamily enzyme
MLKIIVARLKNKLKKIVVSFGIIIYKLFANRTILKFHNIELGKNVYLKSTLIKGYAKLEDKSSIINSKLFGDILISDNVVINNVLLNGLIIIQKNTQIIKTDVFGEFIIGSDSEVNNSLICENVSIGKKAIIEDSKLIGTIIAGDFLKLLSGVQIFGSVVIGNYTSICGPNTDIYTAINKVKIGSFCSIARNVSFQEYNHHLNKVSTYNIIGNLLEGNDYEDKYSKGDIVVENDVWIGTQTVILSGSFISNGVIVAANSVVNGFVPPYAIIGGSPAKIIRYRFSEDIIKELLELKWWEWDVAKIKSNETFFLNESVDFTLLKQN